MHHFHSNSSVVIDAVTQAEGVIKGEIYSAVIGDINAERVNIECTFTKESDGSPVHHSNFMPLFTELEALAGDVTSTSIPDRFQELCTRYIISQLDGNWGLTPSDWTIEEHEH